MAATREDIREWLDRGLEKKATHLIVATDTFDYDDFPVYVMPGEDVRAKVKEYQSSEKMLKVMEVYSYTSSTNIYEQILEHRSWHLE